MINVTNDFLTKEECDQLISIIEEDLIPSPIAATNNEVSEIRNSKTAQLKFSNPIIYNLFLKIANKLNLDPSHGEPLQGQKYLPGQYFKPHTDAFGPKMKNKIQASGNRKHTLMIYLNEDMEGGETNFPIWDLSFTPKIGTALDWHNMKDGEVIQDSKHEGQEIKQGVKYIITSWWRENKFQPKLDKELSEKSDPA